MRMTPQDAYALVQKTLLSIVMEAPMLDDLEHSLRGSGHIETADKLDKLIQDIGLTLKRAMDAPTPEDATAGPITADINDSYEPVDIKRMLLTFGDILPRIDNPAHTHSVETVIKDLRDSALEYTAAVAVIAQDSAAPAKRTYDHPLRYEP